MMAKLEGEALITRKFRYGDCTPSLSMDQSRCYILFHIAASIPQVGFPSGCLPLY